MSTRSVFPATDTPEAPSVQGKIPMLRRYLFVLGARPDRIDDLVQDTAALALTKGAASKADEELARWLRATAKNLLLRDWQMRSKRREVDLADDVWHEEQQGLADDARVLALQTCVANLGKRDRSMLRRIYAQGSSREALGRELGLGLEGVKTALRRLRAALRACIERRLKEQP